MKINIKKIHKLSIIPGFILIILINFISSQDSLAQEPKQVLSIEAYDMLNAVPDTYLIDIRTRSEYQFVGHPVIAYLFPYMFMTNEFGKKDESYGYRFNVKNEDFLKEISKVFKKDDNLLIIGRDGSRSILASSELMKAGFRNVYNVKDGFEGALFPTFENNNKNKFYRQIAKRNTVYGFNHRRHYGWQWWGLPWTYEINLKYIYPPDISPSGK